MNRVENIFVIEWKGPYIDIEQIKDEDFENSFYLITGRKSLREELSIQYCGISKSRSVFKRLMDRDHKHNIIKKDKQIWIGQFSNKKHNLYKWIELSESLIIYYWGPRLNYNKKKRPPKQPIGIINRWQKINGDYRRNIAHSAQKLDDVIIYDGEFFWATNKLIVQTMEDPNGI